MKSPALLIVDDEENVVHTLARSLRDVFSIYTAGSGPAALEILVRQPVDLILTDERMPGMRGVDLLAKAGQVQPAAIGVIISGYSDHDALSYALNLGNVRGFIPKPWSVDELRSRLLEVLLKEHADFIEQVLDFSPDVITLYDIQKNQYVFVNRSAEDSLGYAPSAIKAMPGGLLPYLAHPDDLPAVTHHLETLATTPDDGVYKLECRYRHGSGDWRDCSSWDRVFRRDADGAPRLILTTLRDISERKHTQEILVQMAAIIESTDDAVIGKTLEGRIVSWNAGAEYMYGYPAGEVIGRPISILLPPDRQEDLSIIMDQIRQGEHVRHFETTRRAKDGRIVDVSLSISPIKLSSGQIVGASSIARDITEKKRMEETEREQRRLAEALRDTAAALSSTLEVDELLDRVLENVGRVVPYDGVNILLMDAARENARVVRHRSAYAPAVKKDEPWVSLPIAQTRNLRAVLESGEPVIIPDTATYDGWVTTQFSRLTRSHLCVPVQIKGETIAFLGLSSFQTQAFTQADAERLHAFANQAGIAIENARLYAAIQKSNEELESRVRERTAQLELANRELAFTSYAVAHDLKTPLRAINGFCDQLAEEYRGKLDEQALDSLDRIQKASLKMGRLTDDLLKLLSITRTDFVTRTVDLARMATEINADYQNKFPERAVRWVCPPELPVEANWNLMYILLSNLLDNAWKFTRDKTPAEIEFGAIAQENKSVYFLRDNGIGFDMTYVKNLFGVFQRLHPDAEFEGTGMGLALAQSVIHRHRGSIWAEGAPNQGAAIYFTLG